jgi:hypothetical protein
MLISRVNVICKSQLLSILISKKLGNLDGIKLNKLNDDEIIGNQPCKNPDQILACVIDMAHPLGAKFLANAKAKQIPTLALVDGDLVEFRQQEKGNTIYFDKNGIALFRDLRDYLSRLRWNTTSPILIVSKDQTQAKLIEESIKPYRFHFDLVDSSEQAMIFLLDNPNTRIIIVGDELSG